MLLIILIRDLLMRLSVLIIELKIYRLISLLELYEFDLFSLLYIRHFLLLLRHIISLRICENLRSFDRARQFDLPIILL